ncbi:ngep-related [Anaeramoeba flamelloides]|uniref:Ngep-related n=1 Tax=Anaeramoeba flamelloides TaxID=1746091 RepID=A0ABQ8XV88_9EUKA|nr:ngep-related [Anaeramoeba flamelloides]
MTEKEERLISMSDELSEEKILVEEVKPDQTNVLDDLEEGQILFEYIMVYPAKDDEDDEKEQNKLNDRRDKLKTKLAQGGLVFKETQSVLKETNFIHIGATIERYEECAHDVGLEVRLKAKEGQTTRTTYEEFELENKDQYVESSVPGCVFNSCGRQKLIMEILEAPKSKGGCELSILKLKRKNVISDFFGIHNKEELEPVITSWTKSFGFRDPIDLLRDYFGEKIAFYFAFLKIYFYFLGVLSVIGILFTILEKYLPDDHGVLGLINTIIISIWITVFIEYWKRTSVRISLHWDMLDFEEDESVRPEFKGINRVSPITNKNELYYSPKTRKMKYAATFGFTVLMMCAAAGASIGITYEKLFRGKEEFKEYIIDKYGRDNAPFLYTLWTGIALGAIIFILNAVFKTFGHKLTEWENHRYDSDFENSLVVKYFMFQSVNNYIAIFCSAFVAKDMTYVAAQLMTILITKQIIGNVMEVGIPWLKKKIAVKMAKRKRKQYKREGNIVDKFQRVEKESKFAPYDSTVEDYLEMFIQLGFATFFVMAYPWGPLAPLLAFVNNWFEIRTDAIKLRSMKRPEPRGADGIGQWLEILKFVSVLVILNNILMMTFSYEVFNLGNTKIKSYTSKLLFLVILEHSILFIKFIVHQAVPDVPHDVKIEIERQKYVRLHKDDVEKDESESSEFD